MQRFDIIDRICTEDINAIVDTDLLDNNVLHLAILNDSTAACRFLLTKYRQQMYALSMETNAAGYTPVTLAARLGNKDLLQLLLNRRMLLLWTLGSLSCFAFPVDALMRPNFQLRREAVDAFRRRHSLGIFVDKDESADVEAFGGQTAETDLKRNRKKRLIGVQWGQKLGMCSGRDVTELLVDYGHEQCLHLPLVSAVIKSKWELLGRRRCSIAFVCHVIWLGAFQLAFWLRPGLPADRNWYGILADGTVTSKVEGSARAFSEAISAGFSVALPAALGWLCRPVLALGGAAASRSMRSGVFADDLPGGIDTWGDELPLRSHSQVLSWHAFRVLMLQSGYVSFAYWMGLLHCTCIWLAVYFRRKEMPLEEDKAISCALLSFVPYIMHFARASSWLGPIATFLWSTLVSVTANRCPEIDLCTLHPLSFASALYFARPVTPVCHAVGARCAAVFRLHQLRDFHVCTRVLRVQPALAC
jgi:hypothetical protein